MFSCMHSLVKLKLCRVLYQGYVSNCKVLYNISFGMFELVAAIQICIQNWPNCEDISDDLYQKTPSRTFTEYYQLLKNPQ